MIFKRVIEHVEPALNDLQALEMVVGMLEQDGCLNARVIGDGEVKSWAAQGFFEADGIEDGAWLPDGSAIRLCPESLLTV